MMRNMALLALVIAAGIATPASAQSFVGTWTATANMGDFKSSETLSVTKTDTGYSITGKAIDAPPGSPNAGPGTDVVLEGDKFTYNRTLNAGGNGIVLTYTGTISGDSFTGTADVGGTKIPYTGVRVSTGK
jgi:hypothetical protein